MSNFSSQSNNSSTNGVYIVKDVWSIIQCYLTGGISVVFGFFSTKSILFSNNRNSYVPYFVLAISLLILLREIFRVRAIQKGIIIDIKNNCFEFPGGSISNNNLSDIVSNSFQYFRRYSIKLSSISSIQAENRSYFDEKNNLRYTYLININGSFGAFSLNFKDKNKRDQLYTLIVQINHMGSPILNR